jgi:hypothetical protein
MAYGDFTLTSVVAMFGVQLLEHPDLFAGVPEVAPSPWLASMLRISVPLARAVSTEKARSEWMIAPVLANVKDRLKDRCSLFSGWELNVDPEHGLKGFCDFILARSPTQHLLRAPIAMITEAKNLDLNAGLGQSAAAMIGAMKFNEREGSPAPRLYGAASTGDSWVFLKLEANAVTLDMQIYHIDNVAKILGVLVKIVTDDSPCEDS